MVVVEIATKKSFKVEISPFVRSDFKKLTKRRYFFNWKEEKNYGIFKLQIVGSEDIIGLVSIEMIPFE